MSAIAVIEREQIIAEVAQGTFLDEIAAKLGIAAPNISKHLAKDPEYQQARETGAELRLIRSRRSVAEIAELGVTLEGEIIGISKEVGNLARVREARLRADQWFAEREFPDRWGQRTQVDVTVDIGAELQQMAEQMRAKNVVTNVVTHEHVVDNIEDNQ